MCSQIVFYIKVNYHTAELHERSLIKTIYETDNYSANFNI